LWFLAVFQHKNVTLIENFHAGHNLTCKTIAMVQLALGEKIVEVVKSTFDRDYSFIVATKPKSDYFCTIKHTYG